MVIHLLNLKRQILEYCQPATREKAVSHHNLAFCGRNLYSIIYHILHSYQPQTWSLEDPATYRLSWRLFMSSPLFRRLCRLFQIIHSFFISKYVSINQTIIIFFSIGVIFVISLIILRLLTSLLLFLFDGSISSYKTLNMILGFTLGIFKGALSLVLFTGIFENYISLRLYEILFQQSKILVLLEPIKDYIFS